MKTAAVAGRQFLRLLRLLIGKPLGMVGIFLLRHAFIPLYRLGVLVNNRLRKTLAASRSVFLLPVTTRYAIHAVVVLTMIFVVTNNVYGRETTADEFGRTALASHLVDTQETDIVETIESVDINNQNVLSETGAVAARGVSDNLELALNDSGISQGSIVKPSLTGSAQSLAFDTVEYYIVQGGDTIGSIAEDFGVTQDTILKENNLSATSLIQPGQKLTVIVTDSGQAASHRVKKGETLDKIAKTYGVTGESIVAFNELADASQIQEGDVLIIDGGKKPEEIKPRVTVPSNTGSRVGQFFSPSTTTEKGGNSGGSLGWPARSRRVNRGVVSGHVALDIDGDVGNPIFSADSGVVASAGWGRGYGLHVIVNHGNGLQTLYAHMKTSYVKAGQSVGRGEALGEIGLTGWTTGAHVHFETRSGGRAINPWNYLR